jgi:hypothetical protein
MIEALDHSRSPMPAGFPPQEVATSSNVGEVCPPRLSQAGGGQGGEGESGGQRCPQNVNIGAAQSQQNRIQRFDATVVINAPVVIQCR